jgi:hypothetical protein
MSARRVATLFRRRWTLIAVLAVVLAIPAQAQTQARPIIDRNPALFSQAAVLNYWLHAPDRAPEVLRDRFQRLGRANASSAAAAPASPTAELFNQDITGLPQNEESVAVCRTDPNVVLGGTNDYRAFPSVGTGWHFSGDGGASLANEGILPPITASGHTAASAGDPVDRIGNGCRLFAVDLNFDPSNFVSAIGIYRSSPSGLASCPGGAAASCWPVRRAVASVADFNEILDKPWFDVGRSGAAGEVVWVTYTDFRFTATQLLQQIKAVRCNSTLSSCTAPILISGADPATQFSYVTIGPDGRVYVTWSEIRSGATGPEFVHKLRVAQPGQTAFGPTHVVYDEKQALTFLPANDFRVATQAKNTVRIVNGHPRVFVTWDACRVRTALGVCEAPVIKLRFSDNFGAGWSGVRVLSVGGNNYFPTIANDPAGSRLAVAWYTNRFDPQFNNRQDVELVGLNPATAQVSSRRRVTATSNETEADPLLGGFFIGDYIEVAAHGGRAYVHYNANYRQTAILGAGLLVNQQDNFLARRPF